MCYLVVKYLEIFLLFFCYLFTVLFYCGQRAHSLLFLFFYITLIKVCFMAQDTVLLDMYFMGTWNQCVFCCCWVGCWWVKLATRFCWFVVVLSSSTSLLIFWLVGLSCGQRGIDVSIILDLSISPFSPVRFCSTYFSAVGGCIHI